MKTNKTLLKPLLVASALFFSMQQVSASDFIPDMPTLSPDISREGAMIWEKPGLNRAQYTKVMIEPITIYISPDSKEKGLNADELKALSDGFMEAITNTLEPDIPVVNQPGPGVLYIRAALVDVKMANKKRSLLGYTPIGFVATSAMNAAGARIILKDATLEFEGLDSVTGERLTVLVDKQPKQAGEKDMTWDSIGKTFTFYADRFKARLQAAAQAEAAQPAQ